MNNQVDEILKKKEGWKMSENIHCGYRDDGLMDPSVHRMCTGTFHKQDTLVRNIRYF